MANENTRQHPGLGTLRYDTSLHEWQAQVRWGGENVRLSVPADDDVADSRFDGVASVLAGLEADAVKAFIASQLLELYNDTWSEQEDDIEADDFVARIKPTSMEFDDDGQGMVYFSDGELFAGHAILVSVGEDRELLEAKLAG
jgi:hypothetical protein